MTILAGPNLHLSYRRLAHEGRVDGVLLTDLRVDDPRIALLTELDLPAVAVGRPLAEWTVRSRSPEWIRACGCDQYIRILASFRRWCAGTSGPGPSGDTG